MDALVKLMFREECMPSWQTARGACYHHTLKLSLSNSHQQERLQSDYYSRCGDTLLNCPYIEHYSPSVHHDFCALSHSAFSCQWHGELVSSGPSAPRHLVCPHAPQLSSMLLWSVCIHTRLCENASVLCLPWQCAHRCLSMLLGSHGCGAFNTPLSSLF